MQVFDAPPSEAIEAALPAYQVQQLLGSGGFGAVYRARHTEIDRLVAIKVLRSIQGNPAEVAAFAERFEREARVLARLDHPNIVRIYDFGRAACEPPFFYLVLEHVDGPTLRELMRAGTLSARDVLEFVPQLCDALQAAHELGIVHRDIKPENILVDQSGRVRVADFGLAKLQGEQAANLGLTRTDQVMGTYLYMAPEQLLGRRDVDHRADLYSLGVVVYEMLTGALPLGQFAAPSSKVAGAEALDFVVSRALRPEPAERYQAAAEMRRDIERSQSHDGHRSTSRPSGTPIDPMPPRSDAKRPGSAHAGGELMRHWMAAGLMLLACGLPWIYMDSSGKNITSTFDTPVTGVFSASAFQYRLIFGGIRFPAWIPAMLLVAAATLRTLSTPRPFWRQHIPRMLSILALLQLLLIAVSAGVHEAIWVGVGYVFGLVITTVVAVLDLAALLRERTHTSTHRLRMRVARRARERAHKGARGHERRSDRARGRR